MCRTATHLTYTYSNKRSNDEIIMFLRHCGQSNHSLDDVTKFCSLLSLRNLQTEPRASKEGLQMQQAVEAEDRSRPRTRGLFLTNSEQTSNTWLQQTLPSNT